MWFWYALFSALVSAISIILNKKALKNINASLVSWSLFAFSIPFLIYPAFKDGWPKLNTVFWIAITASVISFAYAKTLSLSGVAYMSLSLLFMYGITTGAVALVSGVKKLEVFFVLIIGWLLFGDKPKKGVWLGSLIMLLGVVLIKFG